MPTGRWISFEGIDGSGKSTLLAGFERRLRGRGLAPLIAREPGG
ncbi:MAG: dTMP kinase, partial [Syntrophobacteraceae bacterium CG07_land_8_20_14_0_80_61_8]